MAWLSVNKAPLSAGRVKKDPPDGLWHKCKACQEIIFRKDFVRNQYVCTKCKHHSPIAAHERLDHFLDSQSFEEHDANLSSSDPLHFRDRVAYNERLLATQAQTGCKDAIVSGSGRLHGMPVQVGAFEFSFMGGSMGSVVGEKISRCFQRGYDRGEPCIIFSASGGARMQEGLLSLMQMAKTCAMLGKLRERGIPMISVLTNPTTGGVAASYAMLGDINIAEPSALIGFAGPRVIRQVTGKELPEGFQTSEYLFEHGMLDLICHRDTLRDQIHRILSLLCKKTNNNR